MGTPIGTPPNAIALGALQNAGVDITFVDWMLRMVPYVIIMLLIAWVLLMFPFKTKSIELKIEGESNAPKKHKDSLLSVASRPLSDSNVHS